MMRRIITLPTFFIIMIALAACQKVVHLNLGTTSPRLVIDGEVTDTTGPYTVKVSQSVDFYSNNTFPPVSGAKVAITDSTTGVTDSLTEGPAGTYSTHTLQGVTGHTYLLYVKVGTGVYTASSAIPAPVKLDSVTFVTNNYRGGKITIQPIPNFQDPPGVKNYYQFALIVNGNLIQKTFIFDDQFSDGRYIHEPLGTDTADVKAGDQLQVNMYCIDKNVYDYLDQLLLITDPGAQSQNAAPANPTSNITGGCLGFFSGHTVSSKSLLVPHP